ncbi:helix-turn-helix domain-containing protein [Streptomyces sp. URMC 123]|uniref:helix-turn-helix domain-containing protein n=1 Tax=Streptomyces sp. URMC 123 TaxID=3423403 RepID=UPI003F1D68B0
MLREEIRRRNLHALLTSCRARLTPQDVGIRDPRRHTGHGLRQEQVASLSGTSTRWYGALERGELRDADLGMLANVAAALRMDPREEAALFCLAAGVLPPTTDRGLRKPAAEQLTFLEHAGPNPAVVTDYAWHVLAWNPAVTEWFGDPAEVPDADRNIMLWLFTDQAAERLPDLDAERATAIGRLQIACMLARDDDALLHLVERVLRHPAAADLWQQPRARLGEGVALRRLNHPGYGPCTVPATTTELIGGLRLILHLVPAGLTAP